MIQELVQALGFGFVQNALAAGLLAAVACGVIGVLVVVNRMVFLAGGIAHAAYGGVGLAFFLGWPVLPCALGFTVAASGLMGLASVKSRARSDTVIGVLWASGMALGVILLDLAPGYNVDLMSFLFGSILSVPGSDVWAMLVLDGCLLVLVAFFYRHLLAMSFDKEFAASRGAPVRFLSFLLPAMIAVSVVMIIRVVGLILVIALLTVPPYLAEGRAKSLLGMMAGATAFSALFCLLGLALSFAFDLTSGASIIAVAAVFFFLNMAWEALARGGASRGAEQRP